MVPNHQSDKYAMFVSQVSIHLPTHPNRILHSPVFLRHQRSRRFLSMSCDFSVWRCGKSFGGLSHVQCLWHGLCLWLCGCEDLVYLCQRSNTHCLKSRMQLSAMSCFKDGKATQFLQSLHWGSGFMSHHWAVGTKRWPWCNPINIIYGWSEQLPNSP